jgi:hypothetical protein
MGAHVTCSRSPCDAASCPPGVPGPSGQSSTSPVPRLRKLPPGGTLSCVLAACQCHPSRAGLPYAVAWWQRFCSLYIVMLGAYVLERANPRENGSLWEERGVHICIRHLLLRGDPGHRALRRHMCFMCMCLSGCHMCFSRCCICCNGYTHMLQMYLPNVSAVLSGCCICCNGYMRILWVYVTNVSPISYTCCKCFIWMLHMLQLLYTYVAIVCFNWFHLISIFCSKFCSPCALTRGHARTHALHARSQHGLSLSCRPAPTPGRNPNDRALSSQSACRAP